MHSQVTYVPTSDEGIYELLEELASEKIIDVNSVIKPWSRTYIANKLQDALDKDSLLSNRQKEDVNFYLRDYRLEIEYHTRGMKPLNLFPEKEHIATSLDPLALTYRDSLFALSIRPVIGMEMITNKNQTSFQSQIGVDGFGYYSRSLGVYANYNYSYENTPLSDPGYLDQHAGGVISRYSDGTQSYNDFRWGVVYSWSFGSFGIVKDKPQWGSSYHGSNILAGRAPSFIQLELKINPARWFEFSYFHGWLGSDVVDSSRSYWDGNNYHEVMRPKYIAANMFTFIPIPHLNISIGNSIIYSDQSVHAVFLVPVLFFRLADYDQSGGDDFSSGNSQMFLDISSRNIKHLHLYYSLYADDLSLYRISDPDRHNYFSHKGGFRLSNWPLQNLSLTAEYTYTQPLVYDHIISTATFDSYSYNLGHYMRDNSQDLYLALQYKPIRGLRVELSYNYAQHFNDYESAAGSPGDKTPEMQDLTWQKNAFGLSGNYAILSNASLFAGIYFSNIQGFDVDEHSADYYLSRYTSEMFWGETVSGSLGFRFGL